jgi:hypothetical protein
VKEDLTEVQQLISDECDSIKVVLLAKNLAYGNSFASPINVFAKDLSPGAQIDVRIDDKLKRIAHGSPYENEDTEFDVIGYLILKRVLKKLRAHLDKP